MTIQKKGKINILTKSIKTYIYFQKGKSILVFTYDLRPLQNEFGINRWSLNDLNLLLAHIFLVTRDANKMRILLKTKLSELTANMDQQLAAWIAAAGQMII